MLLLSLANAGIVSEVGEPVQFELAGTFARLFPKDDGNWLVALGAGKGMKFQTVNGDLQAQDQFKDVITGTAFVDTSITPCGDGGWLVAGSGNVESHNDSLWVYRLDANGFILGNSTVVDRQSDANTNDMVVICTPTITGVGWAENFAHIDGTGQVVEIQSISEYLMGGGMTVWDGRIYLTSAGPQSNFLSLSIYDADFSNRETVDLQVDMGGARAYWPQRMIRLDQDTWVVVSMGKQDGQIQADEGNVFLHFYDTDWELLESTQISQYPGPVGCMRPWVSRRDDTLMVSWDSEIRPWGVPVTIGGVGTVDTSDPSDTDGDSGPGGTDGGGPGCGGCASGGGVGGAGLALLLSLLLRRKS